MTESPERTGKAANLFVKVCGLRTEADVSVAVDAGADAVGFVFARSPRQVDVETAWRLVAVTPPSVLAVGVFKDMAVEEVAEPHPGQRGRGRPAAR